MPSRLIRRGPRLPRLPHPLLLALGAAAVLLVGSGSSTTFSQNANPTPPGGCDWVTAPQRSSDEQDVLIGIRGECPTIDVRTVGSNSMTSMSSIFVCQPLVNPRESACTLPAQSLGRPVEVRLHPEREDLFVDVWLAEPLAPAPPTPTPPVNVPVEGGGALLRWRIPQDPIVRWFEFEQTPVDTSATGTTAPVWTPLDQPQAWAYCSGVTAPSGRLWFACSRDVPYLRNRYRVRACNWSGPNATAGCSAWVEEPWLACSLLPRNSATCPCDYLPSDPGCVLP